MATNEMQVKQDLTTTAIAALGYEAAQVDVIKRSVAKDATLPELYQFLYLSKEYGLDPFKREIYFMKSGNNPSIITGIDGFRKSSKRDPAYEGVQAFAVKEGDEFEIDAANYTVKHKFGAKRGKVIGAWAKADAKGRKPVLVYVDFDEFNKKQMNWNTMPAVMIAKVAESHAIRRQFGLAGLYTKEEMGVADSSAPPAAVPSQFIDADYTVDGSPTDSGETTFVDEGDAQPAQATSESERKPNSKPRGRQQPQNNFAGFFASAKNLGYSDEDIHREAGAYFGIEGLQSLNDIPDITPAKLGQLLLHLRDMRQQ